VGECWEAFWCQPHVWIGGVGFPLVTVLGLLGVLP